MAPMASRLEPILMVGKWRPDLIVWCSHCFQPSAKESLFFFFGFGWCLEFLVLVSLGSLNFLKMGF